MPLLLFILMHGMLWNFFMFLIFLKFGDIVIKTRGFLWVEHAPIFCWFSHYMSTWCVKFTKPEQKAERFFNLPWNQGIQFFMITLKLLIQNQSSFIQIFFHPSVTATKCSFSLDNINRLQAAILFMFRSKSSAKEARCLSSAII